ncbi:MAG TPA: S8 family serine peptidase, partial [Thermoanaerobaculia bacterium]
MTKRLFVGLSLFLLLSAAALAAERHIVLFKDGGAPADFAEQVAVRGGQIEFQHEVLGVVVGLTDSQAASLRGVADVQPDSELTLGVETGEAEAFDEPASPTNPSGAAFYSRQWHHWAIGANKAWTAGIFGSPEVTVAVLDTGIDRKTSPHVDLAGLVDYDRGAQFSIDRADCIPSGFTFSPTDDLMFHGTHVASTISSNAYAAAGVTSRVRLVPVKVLALTRDSRYDKPAPAPCSGGSGSLGAVLGGILYAADIDADVANMSLGGGWYKMASGWYVGLINSTLNYAFRKGMVVVVSAGNEAIDLDHDGPLFKTYCSSPNTICVSATGPSVATSANVFANLDSFAGYSNFGRSSINVAAPGGTGGTSRPRGYVTAACSRSAVSTGLAVCRTGTYVVGSNGTSMASPHVSGLAALVVERVGKNRPALVKAIIEQSADDLWQPGTDP